jgi:hypothetical protein
MRTLMRDPDGRARLSVNARAVFDRLFSLGAFQRNLFAIYRKRCGIDYQPDADDREAERNGLSAGAACDDRSRPVTLHGPRFGGSRALSCGCRSDCNRCHRCGRLDRGRTRDSRHQQHRRIEPGDRRRRSVARDLPGPLCGNAPHPSQQRRGLWCARRRGARGRHTRHRRGRLCPRQDRAINESLCRFHTANPDFPVRFRRSHPHSFAGLKVRGAVNAASGPAT